MQAQKKRQLFGRPPRAPKLQADSADSEESTGTDFDTAETKSDLGALHPQFPKLRTKL